MTGFEQVAVSVAIGILTACLGWIAKVLTRTSRNSSESLRVNAEILKMLQNPEKTGFGTDGMIETIQQQTQVLRELSGEISSLSHYIRELASRIEGGVVPPPPRTSAG